MGETEDFKNRIVQRIRKLSQETANLIAAGEVIVSPVHALKELIENSLDAEAQRITIVLENSGLDTLEIRDDGNGIHQDDLPIVCERFTTSKLSTITDLHSIKSFGFRGEALASLSFISKVSITTCTRNLPLQQYTCSYINGKPVSSPIPIALDNGHGTCIVANSLFYNLLVRRNSINVLQEYRNVLRVVQNYAIHFPHVMFSCQNKVSRSHGSDRRQSSYVSTLTNLSTLLPSGKPESVNETNSNFKQILQKQQLELIRNFYGNDIAEALLATSLTHECFSCKMLILPPNAFSNKKKITNTFILFVNHRLVEHPTLKRLIETQIAKFNNTLLKVDKPLIWVYLELQVDSSLIDINVHPCKRHVVLVHQQTILYEIHQHLTNLFSQTSVGSLITKCQTLLPSSKHLDNLSQEALSQETTQSSSCSSKACQSNYENRTSVSSKVKRCRIDSSQTQIQLFHHLSRPETLNKDTLTTPIAKPLSLSYQDFFLFKDNETSGSLRLRSTEHPLLSLCNSTFPIYSSKTVEELCRLIHKNKHKKQTDSPLRAVYVGAINASKVFLQENNTLLLVKLSKLFEHAVYQSIIARLGRLPTIALHPPIPLLSSFPIQPFLTSLTIVLHGLFSIKIDLKTQTIVQFPLCCGRNVVNECALLMMIWYDLCRYFPSRFINTVAHTVDKILHVGLQCNTELDLIENVSKELAAFFQKMPDISKDQICFGKKLYHEILQYVFFPCINNCPKFFIPESCYNGPDSIIQSITTVDVLYRVFERC